MDLERVRNVKAVFDALPDDDAKAGMAAETEWVKEHLAKRYPALPETDRAMIAWHVSEILGYLLEVPVSDIANRMVNACSAYGLATVELLGWSA